MYQTQQIALVRELLDRGVSKAQVARQLQISRRVIYHWLSAGFLDATYDAPRVRIGRRTKLEPYWAFIDTQLAADRGISAAQIFRALQERGYRGGITRVRTYVAVRRQELYPELQSDHVVDFHPNAVHGPVDTGGGGIVIEDPCAISLAQLVPAGGETHSIR